MERDIREFLEEIGEDILEARGVLRPDPRFEYLLNNKSVAPLLRLMDERSVTRLVEEDRNWFLTHDGEFKNPRSEELKEGNVRDLENPGNVFNEQNRHINPFFKGKSKESSGE